MKKTTTFALTAIATLLLFAAIIGAILFNVGGNVHAASLEPNSNTNQAPSPEQTSPDPNEPTSEEDSFAEVFKTDILPLIVSCAGGLLSVLVMIFPYIKLRGKNKSLQGLYTATLKTADVYRGMAEDFSLEKFIFALKDTIIGDLKQYVATTVESVVKKNVTDDTQALAALKVTTDTISAQFNNLLKAATLAWKEAPGASELLAKSPASEVLNGYYSKYLELKKAFEARQATEISEVDKTLKELEVYHENQQSAV